MKGALASLLRRGGVRTYLALLAVLALAGWAFPLTDHLGYELSELIALAAGSCGAAIGVAALRTEKSARSLVAALLLSQLALLLPLALTLLDVVRRPSCAPLAGLWLYLLLAGPSALLSCAAGFAAALLWARRTGWLILALFAVTLAMALWPILFGPQVFVFHHLGGMVPGPIYDQEVAVTPALLWFRAATLLYALGLAGASAAFLGQGAGKRTRQSGLALALAALSGAAAISLQAQPLHFAASSAQLDEELGGRIETPHLVLHVPREKEESERALLARDAEASVAEVLEFLDASNDQPRRIEVFLYRSADEKRRLIGAADTSFTKPWLRQIHTGDAPAPHPILRHELAHALAADYARGPFGAPGRLFGLVPDMAFIEGLAVAADWPAQESTIDQDCAAQLQLGKLPDLVSLFSPGRFYAEAGANAYTAAGSLVRFVWRTKGGKALRAAYGSPEGFAALGDLRALAQSHLEALRGVDVPPHTLALASLRFSMPSVIRQTCAHELAGLEREAMQASARGDGARAAALWSRCIAMEPDDPALLLQERRALLAAHDRDRANALERQLLAHPKLSSPQRAQLLTDLGDEAWRAGETARAAQRYAEAQALPAPDAQRRALEARSYALREAPRWPATRRLLLEGDAGPETWLLLRDLDLAQPADGFAAYLLAKQAQNARAWESCSRFSASALSRLLPGPLFQAEALRMRSLCAWRAGDGAAARAALLDIVRDLDEAHRLEARSLLHRVTGPDDAAAGSHREQSPAVGRTLPP